MEFVVPRPAADFVARAGSARGPARSAPSPPGMATFTDVTEAHYPQLCARYGVTDIAPPPEALKIVTATLRPGDETQVAIPAGYRALSARAGCSAPTAGAAPAILIGARPITPGFGSPPLELRGEDSTLPVSVSDLPAASSPPGPQPRR